MSENGFKRKQNGRWIIYFPTLRTLEIDFNQHTFHERNTQTF